MELDEVSQLLEVSKQQYQEILSIVQRHADQTVSWISSMAAEFTWVARAVSNSSSPEHLFRITKVSICGGGVMGCKVLTQTHPPLGGTREQR